MEETPVGGECGGGASIDPGGVRPAGIPPRGGGGGGGGMAAVSLRLELEQDPTRVEGSTGTLGRLISACCCCCCCWGGR